MSKSLMINQALPFNELRCSKWKYADNEHRLLYHTKQYITQLKDSKKQHTKMFFKSRQVLSIKRKSDIYSLSQTINSSCLYILLWWQIYMLFMKYLSSEGKLLTVILILLQVLMFIMASISSLQLLILPAESSKSISLGIKLSGSFSGKS